MPSQLSIALFCGGTVLKLALLTRMWQLKLFNRYPIATACLSFSLFRATAVLCLSQMGNIRAYFWLFYTTQPILWVLYFLLLLEFYSLMLEEFPGIRRLARILLFSGLGTAVTVCSILMILEKPSGSIQAPWLAFSVLQDRSVFLCLSALTALFFLLVSYYRLPISL